MSLIGYEQELADRIRMYQESIKEDEAVFEKYGPLIKKMNESAYSMFESGFKDSVYWSNNGIYNCSEALFELHRQMVNRAEGARKAAATRKANKEKARQA
jgi:hypothetical protein